MGKRFSACRAAREDCQMRCHKLLKNVEFGEGNKETSE
jgi:hypothetical protein